MRHIPLQPAPGHVHTASGLKAKAEGRTGTSTLDESSWLREGCWEWTPQLSRWELELGLT